MIDLWTFYFEVMQEYLDGLLDILVACICQGELDSTFSSSRGFPGWISPVSVSVVADPLV